MTGNLYSKNSPAIAIEFWAIENKQTDERYEKITQENDIWKRMKSTDCFRLKA